MYRFTKQENKKWFYIGAAVVVVVLIVAGIGGYNYWTQKQREEQANEIAQSFIEALEDQDYEQLSSLVSSSSLEEIDYSQDDVQERYETIYGGVDATDIIAENMQLNEDKESQQYVFQYDLQMTTSLGELSPQSYQTSFQETEDGFTVNWDPSLIFEEMDLGDTVQIRSTSGERGRIIDRNGELLAGEGLAWQAGLYPTALGEGEEREENLEIIADTFDTTADQLGDLLSAEWVTDESFVPFAMVEEGETPELNGVVYQESTTRTYPLGEAGAHLIGYIGEVFSEDIEENPTLQSGDIIGKVGLEAAFDERLRGDRGGKISIQNSEGEEKKILQEATVEDGEDIQLTIDASLQQDYFDGFQENSGAAVVMAPTSGDLLVLTSSPSYDPTLMARGISSEAYQDYAESPEAPFLPRYTARYAPASTFKVITAAIGLDAGVTHLEDTRTINGLTWQKDDSWGNYEVTRVNDQPTEVNLEDALVYSDNIFFAQEAIEMGEGTFIDGLTQFPFGESFDLPISMQPAQITNSESFDTEPLLADTSFGQGQLLMSPLHQAVFYSPFANGGELVFPRLEVDVETQEAIQPITQETAEIVKELLVQVVEKPEGTAHVLNDAPLSLAAKTGTAEIQAAEAENGNDLNGFLFAFDAEEQSFLSVILIENEWGTNVAEEFSSILEQH